MSSSSSSERALDSPLTFPTTPGMALFPLSPGRVNRLALHSPSTPSYDHQKQCDSSPNEFGHPEFGVPGDFGSRSSKVTPGEKYTFNSPFTISQDASLKTPLVPGSPPKHMRTSADVQAMVSRFNTLDIKDHADLRRKDVAALKRAQMGREEAEAEVKRVRDEMKGMKEDMDEAKERERRVAKRLDGVMEELHRAKEVQAHAQTLYEKEIRKTRKEAFKSSSTLVKLQEELKASRNALRTGQSELELEKAKVARREQDAFAAEYQLVGVQEELARSQAKVKSVEDERETLRMRLKEEEMQRCTAEAKLAVVIVREEEESFYSKNKKQLHTPTSSPEKKLTEVTQRMPELVQELEMHRRKLTIAEEQIEFMKMECQFSCCSCRVAENQGGTFVYDGSYEAEVQAIKSAVAGMMTPPASVKLEEKDEQSSETMVPVDIKEVMQMHVKIETSPQIAEADHVPYITRDMTTAVVSTERDENRSPATPTIKPYSQITTIPIRAEKHSPINSTIDEVQHEAKPVPITPKNVRTITKTTTVPLADHSIVDYSVFSTPTGLTREQAIEQLRQRRGRARSVASTPKKFLSDGFTPRRDVSAPDMRAASGTMSVSRTRPR